jgi:hypothetical protein
VVIVFTAWALLASGWLRAASAGGLGSAANQGSAASRGSAASGCPTCADLYLIRRGWHIDVGFATTDLEPPLRLLGRDFPGARFLIFGFGDRRYLLAKRRGGGTLLAALWPGSALILATGLIAAPDAAFASDQVMTIRMSRQALRSAQVFVWQSLTKSAASPDGPVTRYASGPYEGWLKCSRALGCRFDRKAFYSRANCGGGRGGWRTLRRPPQRFSREASSRSDRQPSSRSHAAPPRSCSFPAVAGCYC